MESETQPMIPEVNPRATFERLFSHGDPAATLEARARRSLYRKSLLDYLLDDAGRLEKRLDSADRRKLDEYITVHDGSNLPYPTIGVRDGHHDLSQHRDDQEKKKKLAQINRSM